MKVTFIIFLFFYFMQAFTTDAFAQGRLIICGHENDLTQALKENGYHYKNIDNPLRAIHAAGEGDGILFIADGYPKRRLMLDDSIYLLASKKKVRIYVEFPGNLPGKKINDSNVQISLERVIVNTDEIAGLDSLQILSINHSYYVPVSQKNALMVIGKVAGLNNAKYGIRDVTQSPLLYSTDGLMVATSKLSNCITGRYAPYQSWHQVWQFILNWLVPSKNWKLNRWPVEVKPSFDRNNQLPENAVDASIRRGAEWFYHSRLLVDSSWDNLLEQRTAPSGKNVSFPLIDNSYPIGNGKWGILEGNSSTILPDGSQLARWWVRADCQAGTAFALAMSANYLHQPSYKPTANNLLNYLYRHSNMRAGLRNDPSSPSFGLIGWATTDPDAYYGDDNARTIITTIGAAAALNTHQWDRYIVEAIMANFRTAGRNGFRGNWFRDSTIQRLGWKRLHERDIINVHPHYESWLWACYLWLYDKTGYKPLLEASKAAIKITMDSYPNWKWTNGFQQERARMILPLSWLVQIENTTEHRRWLNRICQDLLKKGSEKGAIPEALGDPKNGKYGFLQSNAEYGAREAPLIASNSDSVSDLLYTVNYAFFALQEASHINGNYKAPTRKIADFLVRAQAKSDSHPELDGAWFRAFNFGMWNYWASNADADWGALCTETGWTQSWIIATMVLKREQTDFWSFSKAHYANKKFKRMSRSIINKMLSEKQQ